MEEVQFEICELHVLQCVYLDLRNSRYNQRGRNDGVSFERHNLHVKACRVFVQFCSSPSPHTLTRGDRVLYHRYGKDAMQRITDEVCPIPQATLFVRESKTFSTILLQSLPDQ